jgi:hypothetical protein
VDARASSKLRQIAAEDPELRDLLDVAEAPAHEELLQRAALPRRFDESLFNSVLVRDLPSPPGFNEFVRQRDVERVPYTAGQFWIADQARRRYLSGWRERPDRELWARRLAQYFADQPQVSTLELLEQTLRFDEPEARRLFEGLYDEADAKSELARCFSVLQVLASVAEEQELSQETHRTLRQYSALYQSRALFADEFHQTVRYFRRAVAEEAFNGVLQDGSTKWIWHLHGGGGLGKTTVLRRLIAHRLVPRPARVGCVRIDFDAISVSALVEQPWLIGIPIAEQLDPQLEYQVFTTFLNDTAPFRRLLMAGQTRDPQAEELLRVRATQANYWSLLLRNFESVPPQQVVVVFLDTLEEASLHRRNDLLALVDQLATLKAVRPRLRVVLSGRYALGLEPGHVPDYRSRYGGVTRYTRLKRLAADEAKKFVKASAPELDRRLIPALVDRGNGNPFKLSLLIELVQGDASITPERIRGPEFENVDEIYLIERVVRRIPVADQLPVRWVIRYGVVPRRLTPDFIREVLLPALQRALSGEAEDSGDDLIEEYLKSRAWPVAPGTSLDADAVWAQLAAYSTLGGHGWIEVPRTDPGVARFHADVVNPMRRLLRKQRIFADLHRRSLEHFQATGATADVLFHQLELDPDGFAERVPAAFADPRVRHDPAAWRRLAEELITRDFASAPAAARAFIHVQVAEAISAIHVHDLLMGGPDFDVLRAHIDDATALAEGAGQPYVPPSWPAALAAVRRFRQGRPWRAVALIGLRTAARPRAASVGDRARLWLLMGDMRVRDDGMWGVEKAYTTAAALAEEQQAVVIPADVPHERLGEWKARSWRWEDARREYEAARSLAIADADQPRSERLWGQLIQLDVWTGQWERARQALAQASDREDWWWRLQATAALGLGRPLEAAKLCETLLERPLAPLVAAGARYLRAQSYQEQNLLTQATTEFRAARAAFAAAGDFNSRDRCRVAELRAYVFAADNMKEARDCLAQGPLEAGDAVPDHRIQWQLLDAYTLVKEGQLARARRRVDSLVKYAAGKQPHLTAVVLAAAVSLGVRKVKDVVPSLIRALDQIEPVSARLRLLDYLSLGPAWPAVSERHAEALQACVPLAPGGEIEKPVWALERAELLRVIGQGDAANELLKAGVAAPRRDDPETGVVFLLRLEAERRLRADGVPATTPLRDLAGALRALTTLPLIRAAIGVEAAESAFASGDVRAAETFLSEAAVALARETVQTGYHVRARELAARIRGAPASTSSAAAVPQPAASRKAKASAGVSGPPAPERAELLNALQTQLPSPWPGTRLVSIRRSDRDFVIERPPLVRRTAGKQTESLSLLARAIQQRSTSDLPDEIAGSWQDLAGRFARVLDGTELPSSGRERLWLDLPLELAPAPWEFVQIHTPPSSDLPPIRCTLANEPTAGPDPLLRLADWLARGSVLSPAQALRLAAERARSREYASDRPRVVFLDGTQLGDRRYVSSHAYSSLPRKLDGAADVLRAERWVFEKMEGSEALTRVFSEGRPALIYLASALFDSPSLPGPILQAGRIEPKDLDRAITSSRLPRPPVVILDVPTTGSAADDAAQLVARNRFACELFSLGKVAAVLATGLGGGDEQEEVHDAIASNLREPRAQQEVLDSLRAVWEKYPYAKSDARAGLLAFMATALFSNNPYETLAPRGTDDAAGP